MLAEIFGQLSLDEGLFELGNADEPSRDDCEVINVNLSGAVSCPDSEIHQHVHCRPSNSNRGSSSRPIDEAVQMACPDASSLLSQFMEMRGVSRGYFSACPIFRLDEMTNLPESSLSQITEAPVLLSAPQGPTYHETRPAIAPCVAILHQTGCCFIALQLGCSLLQHLESFWPVDHLIDRDFSSHLPPTHVQIIRDDPQESLARAQCAEVDVSLTSERGIVVTTLLQVRQRPLPGSKSLTNLRQRVRDLSQKYRRLVILVCDAGPWGDHVTALSSSDLSAYADFVCWTLTMQAEISVSVVPGLDKTLCRWILSLMSQEASHMVELQESCSASDTTWELFFRHCGLNVRVAQLLCHMLLREYGKSGLVDFLNTDSASRMSNYMSGQARTASLAYAMAVWNAGHPL